MPNHGGGIKKRNVVNQNQHMRAQKNRKDAAITEPHPPENEVDFEPLWRCISKIWRTSRRR